MRCLTLANTLSQRGAITHFISRHMPQHLLQLLTRQGHIFLALPPHDDECFKGDLKHSAWLGVTQELDARDCLTALKGKSWDWLVVDHYALDWRWEFILRSMVDKLLVIDDLADRQHDCDLLLDQNLYHDMPERYTGKVPASCQLLLGPRFALLRDEFRHMRKHLTSRHEAVQRILVFFGGIDAHDFTSKALIALADIIRPDMEVDVVVGAQHSQLASIEALCKSRRYHCHVQTSQMAELMAAADLAIGAGGMTIWERCCLGLPTLAVSTADNQFLQLADAATQGLVYVPEVTADIQATFVRHTVALLENMALRKLISAAGMAAVDGHGAQRVATYMGCTGVEVRPAQLQDSGDLHRWRNHPSIRAVSRNTTPIAWTEHSRWFNAVLSDPCKKLLIVLQKGVPVGVVRFDIKGVKAEASIYLVPDAQSSCRGRDLLQSAEQWFAKHCPEVATLHAHVMGANIRSHRLFMGAGYIIDNTLFSKKLHKL